jgi:hypothetical protein
MANRKQTSEGTPEVDRDVRIDELYKFFNAMIGANAKRTYDEYQNESLRQVRNVDKQIDDLHTIRVQILSLMAQNSDALMKQHLAHRDIATDCTWDPGPGEESLQADKVTSTKRK